MLVCYILVSLNGFACLLLGRWLRHDISGVYDIEGIEFGPQDFEAVALDVVEDRDLNQLMGCSLLFVWLVLTPMYFFWRLLKQVRKQTAWRNTATVVDDEDIGLEDGFLTMKERSEGRPKLTMKERSTKRVTELREVRDYMHGSKAAHNKKKKSAKLKRQSSVSSYEFATENSPPSTPTSPARPLRRESGDSNEGKEDKGKRKEKLII
jgi:hypothetical protein